MRIAAVQDFGKRGVHERDELRWDLFLHKQECIVIGRNLHVLNLPAYRVSATTAMSAIASASTNGYRTSPTGGCCPLGSTMDRNTSVYQCSNVPDCCSF